AAGAGNVRGAPRPPASARDRRRAGRLRGARVAHGLLRRRHRPLHRHGRPRGHHRRGAPAGVGLGPLAGARPPRPRAGGAGGGADRPPHRHPDPLGHVLPAVALPTAERPAGAGARVRDRGGPDRARGRRARAAAGGAGGAAVKRTLPVLRVLIVWVATALTLLLLSVLLSGFHVEDFGVALVASALIGLINAFVWPFVIRVALPLTVL